MSLEVITSFSHFSQVMVSAKSGLGIKRVAIVGAGPAGAATAK